MLHVAKFYGHHQVYQIKKFPEDRTNAIVIFSDKIYYSIIENWLFHVPDDVHKG
jgi:hypothetical protein